MVLSVLQVPLDKRETEEMKVCLVWMENLDKKVNQDVMVNVASKACLVQQVPLVAVKVDLAQLDPK